MSMISRKLQSARVGALALLQLLLLGTYGCPSGSENKVRPPSSPLVFSGPSDQLTHTVIVPALQTPMGKGKNVVWCASFQLAWNYVRDRIVKEPIRIKNAEIIADRLNSSKLTESDLPDGSFYSTAGFVRDGIVEKIRRDMARAFPGVQVRQYERKLGPEFLIAYGYLKAHVAFATPYRHNEYGSEFVDSAGRKTKIQTFEFTRFIDNKDRSKRQRAQLRCIYYWEGEFAVDLCRTSRPNQIILACIPPRGTLGATVAALQEKVRAYRPRKREPGEAKSDTLAVPYLNWRIKHNFKELEGSDKLVLNQGWLGYFMYEAWQHIDFRLDRSGSFVESQAGGGWGASGMDFRFTRPFLIVIRKRGAKEPFFVMWVDNAELLWKYGSGNGSSAAAALKSQIRRGGKIQAAPAHRAGDTKGHDLMLATGASPWKKVRQCNRAPDGGD